MAQGGMRTGNEERSAMRKLRLVVILGAVLALAVVAGGCGKSTKTGGSVTELFGTAPDSLDPGMGYTTQALEPDQTAYIPLLTYAHEAGTAGGKLIPGLATALPTISADGKTYTMYMRTGLLFSKGNTITAKISSNTTANALAVLDNSADVFDFADTIPPSLLPQIQSKASGRFEKVIKNSTYYFFLNTKTKPFSSELARRAVVVGIDRNAIARLGSGFFTPTCFLLPPGITGHPTGACPYGDPTMPDLAKAKELVKQSGMAGTPVTVWGQERSPRRQFVDYYTSLLNQIGFNATEKIIADRTYFPTLGNLKLNAQTGFADWNEDFPNPIDFYGILLAGDAILPTNNQNFGQVNDPTINSKVNMLGSLYKVPA